MSFIPVEGRLAPHQTLLAAVACVNDDTALQIPAPPTLRRTIRKQRQRSNFESSVSSCRADIRSNAHRVQSKVYCSAKSQCATYYDNNDCFTCMQTTAKGDSFLLHDSGEGDGERILIFATERNLSCLAQATTWFADGIFKVTPAQFY
ncbi:uncharacterized protein ISCGN_001926 [Ixodes scapularis]